MIGIKPDAIQTKAFASATLDDGSLLYYMPDSVEANFNANGLNHVDYQIPFNLKINGIKPILKNHSFGDTIYMQIGYMNPASPTQFIEAKRFGLKFGANDEVQDQGWIDVPYASTLPKYIATDPINIQTILRINYNKKADGQAVQALFNFKIHKIEAPQGA
jgi:hypothetical protein